MSLSSLPLVELHRHLDGSVRLQTILELGDRFDLPLPARTIEGLRPHVQVTTPQPGVMAFIDKFKWMVGILVDYDAVVRVAYESVEDAAAEGLDYVELRFSPWFMAEPHSLDPSGVVEAVVAGVSDAVAHLPIKVNLIGILSRTYGPGNAEKELSALIGHSQKICALDLAGDEFNYPPDLFESHFKKAHEVGWHITVHAGESAGPGSIWQAIHKLHAERIGHAIRAVEDPALLDYLADHQIAVESCLTSNVQTSCVPGYSSHPLKTFLEHGIRATINTDDPGISAIDLKYEYEFAAPRAGLNPAQIQQAQANAVDAAFITLEEKQQLIGKNAGDKSGR